MGRNGRKRRRCPLQSVSWCLNVFLQRRCFFFGGGAGRGGQEFDLVSRFFTRVFLSVWRIWSVSESFSAALMCGVCRQPCSLQGESVA